MGGDRVLYLSMVSDSLAQVKECGLDYGRVPLVGLFLPSSYYRVVVAQWGSVPLQAPLVQMVYHSLQPKGRFCFSLDVGEDMDRTRTICHEICRWAGFASPLITFSGSFEVIAVR